MFHRLVSRLSVLGLFALVACGPLVMIPGGQLSGAPTPPPGDWEFSDAVETVQLETRPDDPYSVNVWGIGAGEVFYLGGDRESRWVQHVIADPRVRLRVGESLYELRAEPTDDPADIELFRAGLVRKYDYELDSDPAGAQLFRLVPRSS